MFFKYVSVLFVILRCISPVSGVTRVGEFLLEIVTQFTGSVSTLLDLNADESSLSLIKSRLNFKPKSIDSP